MRNGIILLDKAEGISSAKAIAQVKRNLKLSKIGHAGTLDPLATGLMVCLVGRATRLSSFAMHGEKVYSGQILFGRRTLSDDITGELIDESKDLPNIAQIEGVIEHAFLGELQQKPPQISAIKVEGRAAYARVREDKEVLNLKSRLVKIHSFNILSYEEGRLSFRIHCSSGTYIRAIARDIGELLECGACIEELRREISAPFFIEKAKKIEELLESDILNWTELFPRANCVKLDKDDIGLLSQGNRRPLLALIENGVLDSSGGEEVFFGESGSESAKGLFWRNNDAWDYLIVDS